jgi:hypothetical protein
MKVPKCFVKAKINGNKMNVWRPASDQTWADFATGGLPIWKQTIVALFAKPTHVVTVVPNTKPVKLDLVRVRVLSKDKQEEAFELVMDDDDVINVHSPLFGDENNLEFRSNHECLACKLPWEEDYDFEIDWKDDKLTPEQKHDLMVLQVLHYMSEWFEGDISNDICADFEQDNESDNSESDDEKDYTFADPWVLALDKTSKIQGQCTNHAGEITYVFDAKSVSTVPSVKRSRDIGNIDSITPEASSKK